MVGAVYWSRQRAGFSAHYEQPLATHVWQLTANTADPQEVHTHQLACTAINQIKCTHQPGRCVTSHRRDEQRGPPNRLQETTRNARKNVSVSLLHLVPTHTTGSCSTSNRQSASLPRPACAPLRILDSISIGHSDRVALPQPSCCEARLPLRASYLCQGGACPRFLPWRATDTPRNQPAADVVAAVSVDGRQAERVGLTVGPRQTNSGCTRRGLRACLLVALCCVGGA